GVLIENSAGNTIGGTGRTSKNGISGNHWGVQIDGAVSTGTVVLGNFVGAGLSGGLPLGHEVDGILFTSSAFSNTVGGSAASQGNTIAFNSAAGVDVISGHGNMFRSNAIYANGGPGISLSGSGNDAIAAPVLSVVSPNLSANTTNIAGSLFSQANAT